VFSFLLEEVLVSSLEFDAADSRVRGATPLLSAAAWIGVAGASSAYEFHALHSGQRPSHFAACAPHSTHA